MLNNHRICASCRTLALACATSLVAVAGAHAAQESTIFSYDGRDFVRVKTTLHEQGGKSAANTKLDRMSPAYEALVEKHSYSGQATVLGHRCDAHYAPMTNAAGELTGALFVGVCEK
jgi:hypothetical protein